jgi:hypothetical protein
MGLIAMFAGLAMLCALLWYCAIYALPLYVGLSAGWWALGHGANVGCIAVGLVAGVAVFVLGRLACASNIPILRWSGLAAFAMPSAYTGFSMVEELAGQTGFSWTDAFALVGALAAAWASVANLDSHRAGLAR